LLKAQNALSSFVKRSLDKARRRFRHDVKVNLTITIVTNSITSHVTKNSLVFSEQFERKLSVLAS
jgi:hypothetical protein